MDGRNNPEREANPAAGVSRSIDCGFCQSGRDFVDEILGGLRRGPRWPADYDPRNGVQELYAFDLEYK